MKAVILNSGTGKRMGRLTEDRPKCLVDIGGGETILSRQVSRLLNYNIRDFLITTGPFSEMIKEHLAGKFPGVEFAYVNNPLYESTNYIYSLLLAGNSIDRDIILLHGDLVFEDAVLEKLLETAHADAVLIDREAELPEKDFKGRIVNGLVKEISVNIFDEGCAFLIPMYRLSLNGMQEWLREMEKFQQEGSLTVYAENALNRILDGFALFPVYYSDQFCMEIDNPQDLELAKRKLAQMRGEK